MSRFNSRISTVAAVFGFAALLCIPQAHADGLKFNLVEVPNELTPEVRNAYFTAANRWSSLLEDIGYTINIQIRYQPLTAGILGSTGSNLNAFSYTDFRTALAAHQTSADDIQAVSSLQSGSSFAMMLNGTSNNPNNTNGTVSRTPYLDNDGDANNSIIRLTTANAQALGLPATYGTGNNAFDGLISLSSLYTYDFDQSDGITAGSYDFTGIVEHEIGHALGFISGVNGLDTFNANGVYLPDDQLPLSSSPNAAVSPIDLFRYTTLSSQTAANGVTGIPSFTLGTDANSTQVNQYFSIDNGVTSLGALSTGLTYGDGQQASHWKDNQGIGIMDPTSSTGELKYFTPNDLRVFDVIGYTLRPGALASVSAPEPGSLPLILFMGTFLTARLRRRRNPKGQN